MDSVSMFWEHENLWFLYDPTYKDSPNRTSVRRNPLVVQTQQKLGTVEEGARTLY